MHDISAWTRVLLFLYSTRNLVGSGLAIGGLALFFAGVISDWWFPIVAGLYALGWLAVPGNKELELQVRNEATQTNLVDSLDELINATKSRLPAEAAERLKRIHTVVTELAPKLFGGGVAMEHVVTLVNAVTRDLPGTVKNYMRLPAAFASMHVVENGKTAKQLLLEQLDILDGQLAKIATNIYKDDAEALVTNGWFLKEKFHTVSFTN
ncbi:MAG: hypothetical protein IPN53_11305 [Comamonadaceae bacterium]|nr:hypothetical protein [Comamonadaceae bacterium]